MINVKNHYWAIDNSTTEVYSSATNTKVPNDDPGFVAWGNPATPIASEAELADVLRTYGTTLPEWLISAYPTFIQPAPDTYSKEQLAAYSADVRYNHANGGIVVTSLSAIPFTSDPTTRNTIGSAYSYMHSPDAAPQGFDPPITVQWKLSNGTFITLNTAQMDTLANSMGAFVQACFGWESATRASIESGTTTTLAQIDEVYAQLPNVYP